MSRQPGELDPAHQFVNLIIAGRMARLTHSASLPNSVSRCSQTTRRATSLAWLWLQ